MTIHYSVDMRERFERINKQRTDELLKTKLRALVCRLRVVPKELTASILPFKRLPHRE
jgi:hypothetical protein